MDILEPIAAIALVLTVLATVLWLLRKRGTATFRLPGVPGSSGRRLEVLERVALGQQHTLHLVRAGNRRILVATAPNSCQLLDGALDEEKA